MKTLTVTLKQHTPLIHFQHDQYGATLRASEVKPKLDKFLLRELGGDKGYEEGFKIAKEKGWLVEKKGKHPHPALDYKMRIISDEDSRIPDVHLRVNRNRESKWTTEDFPLLLANMGGRDTSDELMNFSMSKEVKVHLLMKDDALYEKLKELIPKFIATTNFGQRSNKGFGSFTVKSIDSLIYEDPWEFMDEDTLYMEYRLHENVYDDDDMYLLDNQQIVFEIIDRFWKGLRNKVNKDRKIGCDIIDNFETYLKGMKFIDIDDIIQRIPAPIMFKPILYYSGKSSALIVDIYIMWDWGFLMSLQEKYGKEAMITGRNKLMEIDVNDWDFINDYIDEDLLKGRYKEWRINKGGEKMNIEFY